MARVYNRLPFLYVHRSRDYLPDGGAHRVVLAYKGSDRLPTFSCNPQTLADSAVCFTQRGMISYRLRSYDLWYQNGGEAVAHSCSGRLGRAV